MAILRIRHMGDPVLRRKAEPVEEVDDEIVRLIDDMTETMYESEGIGLAAPQVGVSSRVIVFDNVEAGYRMDPQVLVNPEILEAEGSERGEEGCLSIPEIKDVVERSTRIVVEGLGRDGNRVRMEAEGMAARVIQHEIDHLDGILFVDRLGTMKRTMAMSRWKKVRKQLEASEAV